MLKRKKSQGMPVNVIIIAAIALVVLFVMITIFTGRTKSFAQDLQSCAAKQGQCSTVCKPPNQAFIANTDCPDIAKKKGTNEEKCCVQVFN